MHELRSEEEWARQMIERHLGCAVRQHDDGSAGGMHDLDIHHEDGSIAAVEVTAAADGESRALWKLINPPGQRWIEPSLQGGWMVALEPAAQAKRLRRELPSLLRTLEEQQVRALRVDEYERSHFDRDAAALGVLHAYQGGTDHVGSVYCTIEQPEWLVGGVVDESGAGAAAWIGAFLNAPKQADVLTKLDRARTTERHAFVIVPGFTTAPFDVQDLLLRDEATPPIDAPDLPPEVSHVWMVSNWTSGRGFRYAPDLGWLAFDK